MSDNEWPPLVGQQLRELRERRGLSLQALAERAGTSAAAIHRYESGINRFEIPTLRKIARALAAEVEIRIRPCENASGAPVGSTDKLLEVLAPLFWDKPLTAQHLENAAPWVLQRILMYGNRSQVRIARAFFGDRAIRKALDRRGVDRRTRNYWRVLLEDNNASEGS